MNRIALARHGPSVTDGNVMVSNLNLMVSVAHAATNSNDGAGYTGGGTKAK